MNDTQLDVLNIELKTDPQQLGLAIMDDPIAAVKLNEVGTSQYEIISRGVINGKNYRMLWL